MFNKEEYYIYLRKSRSDLEAEMHGEGETLARHEKALLNLAHKQKLNVTRIYREIVSGETISSRPEIQKLLKEVEMGNCSGVLVMEVERLARGDTRDQGTIAEAFKFGNVKIITPVKTYDPNNEFDEEYFEFGLFMSRREYKTINRRLQRGRYESAKEGKWAYGAAPYGYTKVRIKNDKGFTLEIVPSEAKIIRLIHEWYNHGKIQADGSLKRLGKSLICKELDRMHVPTRSGNNWSITTVSDILTNPALAGKIRWKWRPYVKVIDNGIKVKKRVKDNSCTLFDGIHPAIISWDEYCKTQALIKSKPLPKVVSNKELKNPLSGIVYCMKCGKMLTRMYSNTKAGYYVLKCPNPYCDNISAPIYQIEEKLLEGLRDWLENYKLKFNSNYIVLNDYSAKEEAVLNCQNEIKTLNKQMEKTYALLEQEIYTTDIFLQRKQSITQQIKQLQKDISVMNKELSLDRERETAKHDIIPQVEELISLYGTLENFELKNTLLKKVIDHVDYLKTERNKKGDGSNANFELMIYPRIAKRE